MARSPTRWNLRQSTQAQAHASPLTHAFRRGIGYQEFAPNSELLQRRPDLALKAGARRDCNCIPPDNTPANSKHLLMPPGGAPPIECTYLARDKAWMPPVHRAGKRMAFTADYLASHGWTYLGSLPAA